MEKPSRLTKFYVEDVMWIFQLDNSLFRLPSRQFVRHSPHFRIMAQIPVEAGQHLDGQTDEQPIVLPDRVEDFTALVRVLYPDLDGRPSSQEEWISVLRLAHKYEMEALVNEATESLTDLEPVLKLKLAHEHNINKDWITPALLTLIERERFLTPEEAKDVGIACAMSIAYAREWVHRWWLNNDRDIWKKRKTHRCVLNASQVVSLMEAYEAGEESQITPNIKRKTLSEGIAVPIALWGAADITEG